MRDDKPYFPQNQMGRKKQQVASRHGFGLVITDPGAGRIASGVFFNTDHNWKYHVVTFC